MGIVSCLGNSLEEVAGNLHEGKSGITYSEEHPSCISSCFGPNHGVFVVFMHLYHLKSHSKGPFLALEEASLQVVYVVFGLK